MSVSVSSWFVDQSRAALTQPVRRFFMGGSDYSAWVLRWPKLNYRIDTIDLGTTRIGLSNLDSKFGFLVSSDAALTTSCELTLGFVHPRTGEERISLFSGQVSDVQFGNNGAELQLQLQGKTRRLTDAQLGNSVTSGGVDFTGSAYYPSDLAWYLATSYGGFSALADASNPDIDYAGWQAWRANDVLRDVRMKGYFTGQKAYEALNDLALMDSIAMGFQGSKLRFGDLYTGSQSVVDSLDPIYVAEMQLRIDPSQIVNRFSLDATFNPNSGSFSASYQKVNSDSQQVFGIRDGRFGSRAVWFSTAADGRYFAEDRVRFFKRPQARVNVRTPLAGGLLRTVGDLMTLSNSLLGLSQQQFRLAAMGIDLDQGTLDFDLQAANTRPWYYQATIASSNVVVGGMTAVGSRTFLAWFEDLQATKLLRTDGAGNFQPISGVCATAIKLVSGAEVLLGGPSGYGTQADLDQKVIRRSSDAGSTCYLIANLISAFGTKVHDIENAGGNVFIASTTSGGIWRSTDAGSSWALTQVITPVYHIGVFLMPFSGTIWGATGYDDAAIANGLYLWESVDQGATWAPRHTVLSSGDFNAHGFYAISGSEFLLGTTGAGIAQLNVLRGTLTSATSIAWSYVMSSVSFTGIVRTSSGHLLLGFDEDLTGNGGSVYRSLDQGSSWIEDSRLTKQGNIMLIDQPDSGSVDAYVSRMVTGATTVIGARRYTNFDPNQIG